MQRLRGCAGTGRQASLRCWCRFDVWVQVPSAAPQVFPEDRRSHARVVELADSLDSGSSVLYGRAGSSPASRTRREKTGIACLFPSGASVCCANRPLAAGLLNMRRGPSWGYLRAKSRLRKLHAETRLRAQPHTPASPRRQGGGFWFLPLKFADVMGGLRNCEIFKGGPSRSETAD